LDKLNLCYVALTRPIQRLYAFNYYKKGRLGELIHNEIQERFDCEITPVGELLLELGFENRLNKEKNQKDESFYTPVELGERLWYPDVVFRKISNENRFLLLKEQRFGNYFHALMSECNSLNDIDKKLNELIHVGTIDSEFRLILSEKAKTFFSNCESLFTDAIEIINEELILIPNDRDKRPDKIIVKKNELIVFEFKTGKQSNDHQTQLIGYQNVLSEMFEKPIEIYLYYTETDTLLRI
jgi:hypothetical protein